MRTAVLIAFLSRTFVSVSTSSFLLQTLEEGKNVQSSVAAFYNVEAKNVLRCTKLCQHQEFCFIATYNVKQRRCYLYDMQSLTSEVIKDPGWILFNNTKVEHAKEQCVSNKETVPVGSTNGCPWDFRQPTPNKCLSIEIETELKPTDCYDVRKQGGLSSGVYSVFPRGGRERMCVFCDQETDGGGWLLIQRRMDGSEDFFRNWIDYENGFGNLLKEFWIGNRVISDISTFKTYELRVDLEDFENDTRYAIYNTFSVGDASTSFRLTVSGYSGTAGDSLTYHNGMTFATKDNDVPSDRCAETYKGAFWYRSCHYVNVNGLYRRGTTITYADGVVWRGWREYYYSLKRTELKIRPYGGI